MTNISVYVLDSSVFIEASRRYYAFDLAPKFWESLIELAKNGKIQSIDRVKKPELERGKDQLAIWADKNFSHAFASTNNNTIVESFSEIMSWVYMQSQFMESAKADFANGADGWLIAYAKVNNCVVVTQEVLAPDSRKKVPIPNVCKQFNVTFKDTFEMLRDFGVRFT